MKNGGLYKNVKMSVKTANLLVVVAVAVLIFCFGFVISHSGFTVTFDTNGGTDIEPCRVMYGETVPVDVEPYKENHSFTGWYTDKGCKTQWDITSDTADESFTLYAGWKAE